MAKAKKTGARRKAGAAAQGEARAALTLGVARARQVMRQRERMRTRLRAAPQGLLVAEGDSWFDYPFFDILEKLEDELGFDVESVAHKGDTVEEMVYDDHQLAKLARLLEKMAAQRRTPRAILLSGGGNDIAGEEFAVMLNHRRSSLDRIEPKVVEGVIHSRLRTAVIALAGAVTEFCRRFFGGPLPIVLHGYDYPVPDGRGYLGGWWVLPGPWLAPGFQRKGYEDVAERTVLMARLIDSFNSMLATVPAVSGLGHVVYVDLRGTLSTKPQSYKTWWNDELHPTERGFSEVARRIGQAIP
jgi:hypothetical protein